MTSLSARHIDRQSLNLGWSFPELSLPDRITAAGRAGFRNVECQFPYDWTNGELREAVQTACVNMLSINAPRGDNQLGFAAIEGAEATFDDGVRTAIDYATQLGARMVHVLCGRIGATPDAEARVVRNFRRGAAIAAANGLTLLMEPLNRKDNPGYFLNTVPQAASLIRRIDAPNVRLMFDCYHATLTEPDALAALAEHIDIIGHVQIAASPSRAEPDEGMLDYHVVYDLLDTLGYTGHIGAEYIPRAATLDGLAWLDHLGITGRLAAS